MKVKKEQLAVILKISQILAGNLAFGHQVGFFYNILEWTHNPKFPKIFTKEIIGKKFSWEYSCDAQGSIFSHVVSTEEWCCYFKTKLSPRSFIDPHPVFFQKAYGNKKVFESDIVLIEFMFHAGEFDQYKIDMHFH